MKFVIAVVAIFVAVAVARPAEHEHAEILKLDSDVRKDGYDFILETSDGTFRKEEGILKEIGKEHPALVVHGTYTYKDQHDGGIYTVNYVADENGFQPEGKHLPELPQIEY